MNRMWSIGMAVLLLCVSLYGCADTAAQESRLSLYLLMGVTGDEFNAQAVETAQNEARSLAEKQGFEVEIYTALNAQEQQRQLSDAMSTAPGAVILWPIEAEIAEIAVPEAAKNDTSLILYQPSPQEGAVTFSGADRRIGELTARYFNRYFGEELVNGEVGLLEITGGESAVSQTRSQGLSDSLHENADVFHTLETDGSGQDTRTKLEAYLRSAPAEELKQIQAVICQSDLICLNALAVLEQMDTVCRPRLVSGVGGDRELVEGLKEYSCDVVTYSYSPNMLAETVRLGVRAMNGEEVREHYTEPVIEVDKYTVDAYLQSESYRARYAMQ